MQKFLGEPSLRIFHSFCTVGLFSPKWPGDISKLLQWQDLSHFHFSCHGWRLGDHRQTLRFLPASSSLSTTLTWKHFATLSIQVAKGQDKVIRMEWQMFMMIRRLTAQVIMLPSPLVMRLLVQGNFMPLPGLCLNPVSRRRTSEQSSAIAEQTIDANITKIASKQSQTMKAIQLFSMEQKKASIEKDEVVTLRELFLLQKGVNSSLNSASQQTAPSGLDKLDRKRNKETYETNSR